VMGPNKKRRQRFNTISPAARGLQDAVRASMNARYSCTIHDRGVATQTKQGDPNVLDGKTI
jgi:hypothetical protein